ncbi:MAG: class I tRNA ligase family protein [Leptolyngbyaceae cyanobacterium SM1_3_5]|nr:class I tRNA ligase family protein [Leptolyngbyaceae cyanobacterium SM1_3_5]
MKSLAIRAFKFAPVADTLYRFIWSEFCDWYIELVKPRLQSDSPSRKVAQQTLAFVLDGILRLLHPFMPHITEEVWHTLTQSGDDRFLAVQAFPAVDSGAIDLDLEQQFELLFGAIRTIRNLRAEADIKPGVKIQTVLQTESDREQQILTAGQAYIQDLAKVEKLTIAQPEPLYPQPMPKLDRSKLFKSGRTLVYLSLALILSNLVIDLVREINTIVLAKPLFTLVGFGYFVWFARRYLLFAIDRAELGQKVDGIKEQVLGAIESSTAEPIALPAAEESIALPAATQPQMVAGVVGTVQVLIPLEGVVDVEALTTKLQRDLNKVEAEANSLRDRLSNSKFVDKAPPNVVQGARDALAEAEKQAEILRDRLGRLG